MNLGGVEFPQNIIDAIDARKLVVFAGAGALMGVLLGKHTFGRRCCLAGA